MLQEEILFVNRLACGRLRRPWQRSGGASPPALGFAALQWPKSVKSTVHPDQLD